MIQALQKMACPAPLSLSNPPTHLIKVQLGPWRTDCITGPVQNLFRLTRFVQENFFEHKTFHSVSSLFCSDPDMFFLSTKDLHV
jgi:hypothetical protein